MNRIVRPDGLNLDTRNVDSPPGYNINRASMSPSLSTMSIPTVNPEPVYIAPAAAANIVTGEIVTEFQTPMYDEQGNDIDGASVSPASLMLVNQFLDRLLFNFLSCARSTSLASLRPAIIEVLKPRLAKEAIAGADEELQEYLGGDDEELNSFHNGKDNPMDWDLDLVWKRARLRCMVYTRLGDMEEEDEEMYIEQEHLEDYDSTRRVSRDIGIVSPAVAIFLTSILEFVGEHALMVAGQAAYKRIETRARIEARGPQSFQKVVVEEMDMEKVALNPTLGRLWRSWRKILRSPRDSSSSRVFRGLSLSRRVSNAGVSDMPEQEEEIPSVAEVLDPDPASVALPMGEHDVDEIEVPGYSAARALVLQTKASHPRPFSLLLSREWINARIESMHRPDEKEEIEISEEGTALDQSEARVVGLGRARSHSLPQTRTPFEIHNDADSDAAFETPDEEFSGRHVEVTREQPPTPTPAPRKPISAPNTPSYSSVLNVLSQHVARELEASPLELGAPTAQELAASTAEVRREDLYERSEADPAEGALRFDGNDYIINDQERAAIESTEKGHVSPLYPSNDTSFLDVEDHGDGEVSGYSPTSSLRDRSTAGEVSPIDPPSMRSGEVSPIDYTDEEIAEQASSPGISSIDTPVAQYAEPQVSPLFERPEPVEVSTPRSFGSRQRRNEVRTEDDYAKDQKREMFVVAPDIQRQTIRPASDTSSSVSGKDLQTDGTISRRHNHHTPTQDNTAAPALTPLREMTDAAYDSSESTSSLGQSYPEPTRFIPRSIPAGSTTLSRSDTGKRQVPATYAAPGVEKAGVQRVSPSPGSSREGPAPPNRISESSSRDSRGVSTLIKPSLSGRAKNRVASSGDGFRESVASRMSNDGNKSIGDGRSGTNTNDGLKDFDQLINSGETIQYTLTPQNMRAIEARDSFQLNPAPPPKHSNSVRGDMPPGSPHKPSRSQPRSQPQSPHTSNGLSPTVQKPPAQIPRPGNLNNSSSMTKRVSQARDARVGSDNTKDFADFIRSTGPDGGSVGLPPVSTRSSQIAKQNGRIRTSKGPRLQPREPVVRANEQGDLINFLRQGPPGDSPAAGANNITGPRAAPRTAPPVDSMLGRARDTYSVASTQDSFVSKSIQSSTGSRTGLLDSSRAKANAAAANAAQSEKRSHRSGGKSGADAEGGMPARKRRAPRDPYAIDTDSEDDDGEPELSMGEFLDSHMGPPPPDAISPGPLRTGQRKSSNAGKRVVSGLGNRLSKTNSSKDSKAGSMAPPPPPSKKTQPPSQPSNYVRQSTSPIYGAQAQASALGSRGGRIPSSNGNGNGNGTYPSVSSSAARSSPLRSNPAAASVTPVAPAKPRMQLKARDAREEGGSSRELADFFRASSPPPNMMADDGVGGGGGGFGGKLGQLAGGAEKKEKDGGFARIFSQRKKSTPRFG